MMMCWFVSSGCWILMRKGEGSCIVSVCLSALQLNCARHDPSQAKRVGFRNVAGTTNIHPPLPVQGSLSVDLATAGEYVAFNRPASLQLKNWCEDLTATGYFWNLTQPRGAEEATGSTGWMIEERFKESRERRAEERRGLHSFAAIPCIIIIIIFIIIRDSAVKGFLLSSPPLIAHPLAHHQHRQPTLSHKSNAN
jgi:hypothetical protein